MGLLEALGLRSGSNSRVKMLCSVDQYVAGESYDLPVDVSDRFIVRGYAEGRLSREFTPEEVQELSVNSQVVTF